MKHEVSIQGVSIRKADDLVQSLGSRTYPSQSPSREGVEGKERVSQKK